MNASPARRSTSPPLSSSRFFTIPNLLSIARALLTIPFVVVMLSDMAGAMWWGLSMLALAALTDKFDGVLARKYNEITEWGKILDPLADKIGIAVVAVVLVHLALIPMWFLVAVVARDVLILAGGLFLKAQRGTVVQSTVLGKWTIGVLAATMALAMMRVEGALIEVSIWVSLVMLAASLAGYVGVFVKAMKMNSMEKL